MTNHVQPCIIRENARGYERIEIEDELMQNREIFLTDPVSPDSMNSLLKQLMFLNRDDPDKMITLYINSPGGEVQSGIAVYDWMKLMPAPLTTVCVGTAASMGAILFLAGSRRIMTRHSRIMIHDPAPGGGSLEGMKPAEIEKRLDDLKQTREVICGVIAEAAGKTAQEIMSVTCEDSWFSAEEAIQYGLATEIMGNQKGDDQI